MIRECLLYFLTCAVATAHINTQQLRSTQTRSSIRKCNAGDDKCIPYTFDLLRNVNGRNYVSPVKNQDIPQYCDASWAVAATSAISDRMRYLLDVQWPLHELSSQVLINCVEGSNGCYGGDIVNSYIYIRDKGIPGESCMPYTGIEERCYAENICRYCSEDGDCEAVTSFRKYYIDSYGFLANVPSMMTQLVNFGTITCQVYVTPEFVRYRHGVFIDSGSTTLYTHYVNVVGWGVEDDLPYWIVRNSWGSYWGENGYIRILRGYNLLGIEGACSFAVPVLVNENNMTQTTQINKDTKLMKPMNTTKSIKSTKSTNTMKMHLKSFMSCGYPTDWTQNKQVIVSPLPWTYVNVSSLPKSYDVRNIYGHDYTTPIRNQNSPHFCNACWAQATTSALSDRLYLMNSGAWPMIHLSSQVVINCATGSCTGGDPGDAYRYAYYQGIPDESCQAYVGKKKNCNAVGICMDCSNDGVCSAVSTYRKVMVREYGEVQGADNMKAEIYARGPITCFMVMTEEFMEYESGVFVEHDHKYKGGHIVEVAGWGVTATGQRYWIARNNWGENWGENGWFRINMGGSNLMIESSCSWGVPYVY